MKAEINIAPLASPRPRFVSRGKFVTTYMPKNYTLWKKQFLAKFMKFKAEKFEKGQALEVNLAFYIKPPMSISKVKKNQNMLKADKIRVITKPDLDNLEKSVLDALNRTAWHDDSQITDLSSKKRYSLNPRVEIEVESVEI